LDTKYIYRKTHILLGNNSYMFRPQGAILRELKTMKIWKSSTYFSWISSWKLGAETCRNLYLLWSGSM